MGFNLNMKGNADEWELQDLYLYCTWIDYCVKKIIKKFQRKSF